MKIALLEPLNVSEELIEELAQPIKDMGHEFVYYDEKTTDNDELAKRSQDADIVMIANNPYPKEAFENADKLEYINVAFTGIDHVDGETAEEKSIKISNSAGYADQAVAELVIGLTLDLYRSISQGNKDVRADDYPGKVQGMELKGKTVGIIGVGNIGVRTAGLFNAFGVDLLGYDENQSEEAKDMGMEYVELDELLEKSDVVSVHLPLNEGTRGFLDKETLSKMKDSAILINCARGPIIDNDGLAELLDEEKIAGAGIDVFDMEPPIPSDYPLLNAKNTILTPHVAYLSDESMVKRAHIVFDNTISYLNGEPKNILQG